MYTYHHLSCSLPKAPQALGCLVVVVLSICFWRRYVSSLRDVPGPLLASVTRLWHMRRILLGDQNLELSRLHDKHGHFVRIAPNEVSISHPDAIRKVLLAPLRKGDWYKIVHFPDSRYKNPMGETDPATKIELSRHLASGYLLSNLLQSEPAMDDTVELLLGWMDKAAEEGQPIEPDQLFTYTTFDVVGEVIFSKPFGFLIKGSDVGGAIATNLKQNIYAAIGGYVLWLHVLVANPFMTWLNVLPFGHIVDTAMAAIREREKNPDARFDAVAHWFRYLNQNPGRMHPREIQTAASNTVAAGADTVACGLQSFVYHMIRRPELWERVRKETDAAGLASPGMASKRVISYADAQGLPLLGACIKESLRIFGPAPMGLPRVAGKDGMTIGDRFFPEGTTVSVSAWVIHHSEEIWGPDAREFRPERWLEGDKSAALDKYYMPVSPKLSHHLEIHPQPAMGSPSTPETVASADPKRWMQFGAGYMSCPGQNLARIELSKICATLVRDYDIRQVHPELEWQWKAYFVVAPHSWPCYVEKRKRAC